MSIKDIKEGIKDTWDYLTWRDMGEMGEGCLISIIYWGVIITIAVTAYLSYSIDTITFK